MHLWCSGKEIIKYQWWVREAGKAGRTSDAGELRIGDVPKISFEDAVFGGGGCVHRRRSVIRENGITYCDRIVCVRGAFPLRL